MPNEKELQKLFGRNVRQLREARGLTQEEFSSKAGINRSYLGGVERGQRTICMDNIGSDIIGIFNLYGTSTRLAYAENGGRWF